MVVGALYLFFLGHLLIHGLVIWRGEAAGVVSLGLAAAMVVLTVVMARTGAFDRHAAVELRATDSGSGFFAIAAGGRHPDEAWVTLDGTGGGTKEEVRHAAQGEVPNLAALRGLRLHFPAAGMKALGIRVHKVNASGESEPLRCRWEVNVVPGPGRSSSDPGLSPSAAVRRLAAGESRAGVQSVPLPPEGAQAADVIMRLRD